MSESRTALGITPEMLLEPPTAWRPAPGDTLIGTVSELDERRGYGERPYPIVVVLTAEGREVAFHAFHTVAKDEVSKRRPRVGDQIGIAYLGKGEAHGEGQAPELYRVIVRPSILAAEEQRWEPDWDSFRRDLEQHRA